MRLEKEEWLRKVSALETAMDIYIEKGYLHNDRDIIIAKGPAYCTTAYGNKAEMSRHTTLEWAEIAKYPLDIQLAIPRTGKIENFLGQILTPSLSECESLSRKYITMIFLEIVV